MRRDVRDISGNILWKIIKIPKQKSLHIITKIDHYPLSKKVTMRGYNDKKNIIFECIDITDGSINIDTVEKKNCFEIFLHVEKMLVLLEEYLF